MRKSRMARNDRAIIMMLVEARGNEYVDEARARIVNNPHGVIVLLVLTYCLKSFFKSNLLSRRSLLFLRSSKFVGLGPVSRNLFVSQPPPVRLFSKSLCSRLKPAVPSFLLQFHSISISTNHYSSLCDNLRRVSHHGRFSPCSAMSNLMSRLIVVF